MSDDGDRQHGHAGGPEPRVFIKTLGVFESWVDHTEAIWKGCGAGAGQLKRALALLIARRDQPVRREVVLEVAGGYALKGARNVIPGLRKMLHSWGIEIALTLNKLSITLHRHALWQTDGDRIDRQFALAHAAMGAGDAGGALASLDAVEDLCGGLYLPIYDSPPEYAIDDMVDYWQQRQKETLQLLARVRVTTGDPRQHAPAMRAAARALRFDRENPASYLFAAQIARQCGNEERARSYERLAPRYRAGPAPG